MAFGEKFLCIYKPYTLARSTRDMGEDLFGRVLPRHHQLVIEINRRFQERSTDKVS